MPDEDALNALVFSLSAGIMQSDSRVGTTIGEKYRIERLLGAGGMGAVYEATNTWTERRVALKLLHPEYSRDGEVAARFLREARVATKVAHPNIVEVLDMGQDPVDKTLYLVQQFLEGRDLRALMLAQGRLSIRETYELLVPVMSALVAAGAKGIVHRDLKPENIFLCKTDSELVVPKIIDFGIAKVADQTAEKGLTKTSAVMGTPYYMSPEQAKGSKDIDAQTDVWAMGVIWFEVLAARCPYEGETYNELLAKILMDPAPSLTSLVPTVPPSLAAVVDRALAKAKTERWRSAQELLVALLAVPEMQGEPWLAGLRVAFEPRAASGQTGALAPLAAADASGVMAALPQHGSLGTTLGRAATDLSARHERADGASRTKLAAFGGAGFGLLLVGGFAAFVGSRGRPAPETRVLAVSTASAVATAASAPAAPSFEATLLPGPQATAQERFVARVTVHPAGATMTLDGAPVQGNVLIRELARDGADHALRVRADGYEERVVSFRDVPPPERIELVALRAAPRIVPTRLGVDRERARATSDPAPSSVDAAPHETAAPPPAETRRAVPNI